MTLSPGGAVSQSTSDSTVKTYDSWAELIDALDERVDSRRDTGPFRQLLEQLGVPHPHDDAENSENSREDCATLKFELLGSIEQVETIATGREIRELSILRDKFGGRNWSKKKGVGLVRLRTGEVFRAELHWYECHGVGRKMLKVKGPVEPPT